MSAVPVEMTETVQGTTGASVLPPPTTTVRVSDKDELDVWVVGEGTPVVLIHGAIIGSLLQPVAERLAEQGEHQVVWYRRRGYNGKPTEPAAVPEQARDLIKVLDAVGIDKAHVVGHSAGGVFALAVALEAPDRVLSAALFDAALTQVPSAGMLAEMAMPAIAKLQEGDVEGAAAALLAVLGATRGTIERVLPGAWSTVARDAAAWFQADVPMLGAWTADPAKVQALDVPLAFLETGRVPPIHETGELLQGLQPDLTVLRISTADHFFPLTATEETAAVIDGWIKSQRKSA